MADVTITGLPNATTPLDGSERVPMDQAGATVDATTADIAATVANSVVIGKVLTGYVSGAGTVAATDTILQAIQKLNGNDSTFLTQANASATYQPLDADLTSIAALTTTTYGRSLLTQADASATRSTLGLGTLATQTGTFSGTSSGTNTGDQDLSTLLVKASNLSDLTSASTARTNLGLGTAATTASDDYAPAAQGVTGGNAHDHNGGDGAQIAYSSLSGLPTLGTAAAQNVGTSAGNVLQLDGSAKLPAVDGSALTGINTAGTDLAYTASTRLLASSTGADVTLPLLSNTEAGLAPASGGGTTNFLRADGTFAAPPSAGISDGDKGDITVSASGATWTVDNGAITLAKQADVATASVFYRKSAGTGAPEVQSLATLKTDLGLTGTNSGDQDLSSYLTSSTAASTYQPLDSDLTSIAALTTASAGRSLLTLSAVPSGALVGTTDTQTLSAKTFANLKETVFTITDAAAFEIDPANGPIQVVTLGANRTPVATNFGAGQSMLLAVDDGSAFAITWTSVGTFLGGAAAPALYTSGYSLFELFVIASLVNIVRLEGAAS